MPELARKTVEISCAKCGKKTRRTIAWVRENSRYTCTACGSHELVDQKGLEDKAAKVATVIGRAMRAMFGDR